MKKFFTLRSSTSFLISALALSLGLLSSNARAADIINETLRGGSLPPGWTESAVTFSTGAGGYANFTTTGAVLTSPVIDLSGYTGVTLQFDVAKFGSGADGPLTVEFSNDGGTTWTAQTFNSPTPTNATYLTSGPTAITASGPTVRFRFTCSASPSKKRLRDVVLSGTAVGPYLTATPLTAFGNQCINAGPYGPNMFTITGGSLTTADVTVAALSGFTYSTTSGGTYTSSLSLTQPGGTYTQTIFVKFDPTAIASYNGNIAVGGGGATGINVAADGSGVDPAPAVTTGAASSITATGATVAGTLNTATSCGTITAYGIEYSTTMGFTSGTGTPVASTNMSFTAFSSALTGLNACTTYYTHAYATRASGTTYGSEGSFTTDAVASPVATAGSSITGTSFSANWGAVAGATGYSLDVSTSPTFGTPGGIMVGWDFNDDNTTADSGLPANAGKTISTTATGAVFYSSGVTGDAIKARGWDSGSGTKYWQVDLVTTGYYGLTVSSTQWSAINGPRDFKIQYKIGTGGTWTDVPGGSVTVANDFSSGAVSDLSLPSACDNNALVYLRWIMTSNTPVSLTGSVTNNSSSSMDDISVDAVAVPGLLPGYDNLNVGNVTSYPVTGLSLLTTYYYRVRAEAASCASGNSNVITVVTGAPTYFSRATGDVSDPIWSSTPLGVAGPASFASTSSMVVQTGNVVTNTSNVSVDQLTVESGGTLVLDNSATISVSGDADFSGTLTANDNSTLALLGTGGVVLSSTDPLSLYNLTANVPGDLFTDATIDIRGTLLLEDGDFDASTGAITLMSDVNGTGRLGAVGISASYSGNMTVQRYIPAGHTNWRMLGSPVASQTVNDWQDDFFTAGYPGSAYPNFYSPIGSGIFWPSVRYYDETNTYASADTGIVGVSSNTQALTAGQGFFAWSGDNFSTTGAFTMDVTGEPNVASTPITLPMSYTSSGTPAADGWNLVSNPVPSPIDFDAISLGSDVAAMYSIFNPVNGTSQSYSGGIGQGNVNGIIQSSQGFWLQASGSNVTTTVSETDKVNAPAGGVFGGSQQAVRPIVRLFVASAINAFRDEATIVFDQGTPDLDAIDARKMPFRTVGAPLISSQSTDGDNLAIDFFGAYTTDISIPVAVNVDVTGTYTISAGITGMKDLSCLSLEDLTTGTITPLTDGASYSFAINANDDANTPRFLLHGTAPLPFYAQDATCANTPNGLAAVMIDNGPVDVTWTDASGTIVATMTGLSNVLALNDELTAGNYSVRVSPIGVCGGVTSDFSITAPSLIGASDIAGQATSCPNSTDGSVSIEGFGGTGELSYLWNDGTTGPQFIGAAGEQLVNITDETGCSQSTSFIVEAGEGATAGFTAGTAMATEPVAFTNTSTESTSWTWDFGDGSTSTDENPTHTYATAGTYTVTLTAADGTCTDVTTQEITVEMATVVTSNAATKLNVYATDQELVIDHAFGNAPVDVSVYDISGRMAMSRASIVEPGRITLADQELGTGVWFVRVKSGDVERTFRVPLIR